MKKQFRKKYIGLVILLVLSLTVLISCDSDNTPSNHSPAVHLLLRLRL